MTDSRKPTVREESLNTHSLDRSLFYDVGHFIAAMGGVEVAITGLIAALYPGKLGPKDWEDINTLIRGMDMRVKIQRLRQIAGRRKGMGPNLSARLKHLDETLVDIRNTLLHSGLAISEDGPDRVFYYSIASLPFDAIGKQNPGFPDPGEIDSEYLFNCGRWLFALQLEIYSVWKQAKRGEVLEIENPKTTAHTGSRPAPYRKGRPSRPDRPGRK